jgi:hypothetical protein
MRDDEALCHGDVGHDDGRHDCITRQSPSGKR